MSNNALLIVVVVIILIGALPTWPYSSAWGYVPAGGLVVVLVVLLALVIKRRV